MPKQLMCPMRSDSKTVRHCQPDKCMWGRSRDEFNGDDRADLWVCSIVATDNYHYQMNALVIPCPTSD